MKLVVDTNVLFSYFWKNSITQKLLISSNFELISPSKALEEIKKYSKEIITKTGLSKSKFSSELRNLKQIVKFIEKKDYSKSLKEAEDISPDKGDIDFFALCMKEGCFLWSNDSKLKNQEKIKVITTEELIEILF